MAKNIMFLVTGMTPQIITETLWALACDPDSEEKWIPDEIHVASTEHGLNQIRARLFEQGNFAQMQQEYPQLAGIDFTSANLHGIPDAEGVALSDLRTPEDNELAADFICAKIYEFTKDESVSLHVSIAGGRKTMGFYAGYALSLYGRAQDRMSHVLVDERYEQATNFYYPSQKSNAFALDRDGKVIGASSNARIWLAQIPFVRMKEAIEKKHQLQRGDKFSQVVDKINESYNDARLELDVAKVAVTINEKFSFTLPPREFAFLHLFASFRKAGEAGIKGPRGSLNDPKISADEVAYINKLTAAYRELYLKVKPGYEHDDLDEKDLDFDKGFFEHIKSRLKTKFEEELGLELAAKVAVVQDGRSKPYNLNLPPSAVHIKG